MREAVTILAEAPDRRPGDRGRDRGDRTPAEVQTDQPQGGGASGGSSPGGGGGGTTNDSALALLGRGVNEKEVREDHGVAQATGDAGAAAPRGIPRRA